MPLHSMPNICAASADGRTCCWIMSAMHKASICTTLAYWPNITAARHFVSVADITCGMNMSKSVADSFLALQKCEAVLLA